MSDGSSRPHRARRRRAPDDAVTDGADLDPTPRSYRRLPPAVTPLSARDLAAGVVDHRLGRGLERFREQIASTLDASSTGTYTSFRRALAACLHKLAAGADDGQTTVLIPGFCSQDYADAIEGIGLTPRRYDIDPRSLSVRMHSLTERTTDEVLAVVVNNVLGYGSAMTDIATHCRTADVHLIEAIGYAYGTQYRGDRLGTFGDCAVVNFQQGKPIPVGGGMVVSQTPELVFGDDPRPTVTPNMATVAGYAALGRPRPYYGYTLAKHVAAVFDAAPDRPSTHPESKFEVAYEPPFASLADFHGAVGRRILDRLATHRQQRAETATAYATALADCPHVSHIQPIAGLTNLQHVRYPLVVDDPDRRASIRDALDRAGVETAALYDWPPLSADTVPGAAQLQSAILTLPTHPYVDTRDRQLIVETVREAATSG